MEPTQVASRPSLALPPGPPARGKSPLAKARYYAQFARDPFGFVTGRFERYGDIYFVCNPDGSGLYVLRHPDHLRQVLLAQAGSFSKGHTALARLRLVLGEGLLTSDGETWKRHRRMVQPAFHHSRIAVYAGTMVEEAERAADRWARLATSGTARLDLAREMMELTLRIVSRTLFSHDVGGEADRVASAMRTLQDVGARPPVLPEWIPTPSRMRGRRAVRALDGVIAEMTEARRAAPGGAHTDLLQMLLAARDDEGDGSGLTNQEVRDHLVTFFLAGHETTSNALTWTWYLLARHPEARAQLEEELGRVLGGRAPTYDDLPQLPYAEQVLKEAMRLYPPAYVLARRAERDVEIGGYHVPAGSEVVLWTYVTHHDPRWYPDPFAFRPERFAREAEAELPKLAYLPFGAGPRACVGKAFAMIEAQLLLATLAQRVRFEVRSTTPVRSRPRVTLTPDGGLPVQVLGR